MVLVLLGSWCYRCAWDHHGGQVNFLVGKLVVWLDAPSSVAPFCASSSSPITRPAFQSICLPLPLMSVPVFVLHLGLLTQSSSSSIRRSILSSELPQASFSHHCRSSSSPSPSSSRSPLTLRCAGGLCVRGPGRRSLSWSSSCVCAGGSSLNVGSAVGPGTCGRLWCWPALSTVPDFVLCFWFDIRRRYIP